jgi:hypothetical protein
MNDAPIGLWIGDRAGFERLGRTPKVRLANWEMPPATAAAGAIRPWSAPISARSPGIG